MLTSVAQLLLVAVFPALLVGAAVWDLASFTIPNVLPAAMTVLFFLFAALAFAIGDGSSGMTLTDLGLHVAAGLVALAGGIAVFAAGWVGGGDAKLYAVAALWLGWQSLLEYTLMASLLGGALTLALLSLRRMPLPAMLHDQAWLMRLADRAQGVPYGIALVAAALIMLPESELFRLAVG